MPGISQLPPRRRRIRLAAESYRKLRRLVLERDSWRCQFCGQIVNLQVHHLRPRSQQGDDKEENLITLCRACHERVHRERTLLASKRPTRCLEVYHPRRLT